MYDNIHVLSSIGKSSSKLIFKFYIFIQGVVMNLFLGGLCIIFLDKCHLDAFASFITTPQSSVLYSKKNIY